MDLISITASNGLGRTSLYLYESGRSALLLNPNTDSSLSTPLELQPVSSEVYRHHHRHDDKQGRDHGGGRVRAPPNGRGRSINAANLFTYDSDQLSQTEIITPSIEWGEKDVYFAWKSLGLVFE